MVSLRHWSTWVDADVPWPPRLSCPSPLRPSPPGGVLAFLLILVEVVLVKDTSSLTLSVLGILKTVLQVVIAIFLFGDDLGVLKAFGMVVIFAGLLGYAAFKQRRQQQDAAAAAAAVAAADATATADAAATNDAVAEGLGDGAPSPSGTQGGGADSPPGARSSASNGDIELSVRTPAVRPRRRRRSVDSASPSSEAASLMGTRGRASGGERMLAQRQRTGSKTTTPGGSRGVAAAPARTPALPRVITIASDASPDGAGSEDAADINSDGSGGVGGSGGSSRMHVAVEMDHTPDEHSEDELMRHVSRVEGGPRR